MKGSRSVRREDVVLVRAAAWARAAGLAAATASDAGTVQAEAGAEGAATVEAGAAVPDRRLLPVLLAGIALHSFLTGLGLLLQPASLIAWAGWTAVAEPFFPAQGGVFHILMAVLYAVAARRSGARRVLLPFIVFVKAAAAVFLLAYYLFVDVVWIVLCSGLLDGAFAIAVAWLGLPVPAGSKDRDAAADGQAGHEQRSRT